MNHYDIVTCREYLSSTFVFFANTHEAVLIHELDYSKEPVMATVSTEPCDIPQAQNPVDIPQDNLSSSPSSTQDVGSPGSSLAARRSRQTSLDYTLAERDALSQVAMDAEMKLTAKRAARAEARDIRLKEMEKQQKESEEQEGKDADQDRDEKRASSDSWGRVRRRLSQLKHRVDSIDGEEALLRQTTTTSVSSSRRSSADSIEQDAAKVELEEKYKKAMMTNAQLDNEKTTLVYEVEALKDMVEDRDEQMMEYQREAKEKHRDLQAKKRENANLVKEIEHLKELVIQRDQLIADHGLLFVCDEDGEVRQEEKEKEISEERRKKNSQIGTIVVISPEASQLLEFSGDGPLDVRLKRLVEERKELMEEVRKLKIELDEEKERVLAAERRQASPSESMNGPDVELLDLHRETTRQATEYKYKLQRTEQEIATLEGNVLRLESQVKRYKAAAEASEKIEEELKVEKRKTTRELRSLRDRVDELETENGSLKKRIEKFRKREIHS